MSRGARPSGPQQPRVRSECEIRARPQPELPLRAGRPRSARPATRLPGATSEFGCNRRKNRRTHHSPPRNRLAGPWHRPANPALRLPIPWNRLENPWNHPAVPRNHPPNPGNRPPNPWSQLKNPRNRPLVAWNRPPNPWNSHSVPGKFPKFPTVFTPPPWNLPLIIRHLRKLDAFPTRAGRNYPCRGGGGDMA